MRQITAVANLSPVRISLASALGGVPGLAGDCTAEANADMNLNTAQGRANYAAWQACVPDRAPNAPPATVPFNGDCGQPSAAGFPGFANLSDVAAWQAKCNPTGAPVATQTCPPGYKWDGINGMGIYDGLGVRALAGLGACVPIAPLPDVLTSDEQYVVNKVGGQFASIAASENATPKQLAAVIVDVLRGWGITPSGATLSAIQYVLKGQDHAGYLASLAGPSTKYTDAQLIAGANSIAYDPTTIGGAQLTRIQPSVSIPSAVAPGSVLAYMLGLGGGQPAGTVEAGADGKQYQMQNGAWRTPPCPSGSTWTDDGVGGMGWYRGLSACSALVAGAGAGSSGSGSTTTPTATDTAVNPLVVVGGLAALAFFLLKK